MAEKSTIARPYAQAIFDLAASQNKLEAWSQLLGTAALVASDKDVQVLIGNPRIESSRVTTLFSEICATELGEQGKNVFALLAENGRLSVLPEISAQYEVYKAEAEKTVQAEVVSAYPVSDEQQAKIADALKARLGCDVTLECQIDKSLVGGAIIRAGDLVIEGTVIGQLEKLKHVLSQ